MRALVPINAGHARIALDPSWRPGGAVVFAQRADLRITGAKVLQLAQPR